MATNIIHGGCLCGAVRYEARGEPYNVTHCHCADCRRSGAAAFITWASFAQNAFRLTQGEMRSFSFAGRLRSFCPQCGTALTFRSDQEAEEVDVTVCSFDHPELVSPADHIWIEDRLPWIQLADELPAHAQNRPAATPNEP